MVRGPDAVLDYLARFGWSSGDHELRLSRSELVAAFDWAQCGRGDGKFDPKKFLAIDHDHLKSQHLTPDDEYARRTVPFMRARGLDVTQSDLLRALPSIRERAQTFVQAADLLDPFFREPPVMDEKAAKKFLVKEAAPTLRSLHHLLFEADDWSAAALEARVTAWLDSHQLALKDIGQPARVALTGRTASPSLFEVLAILGQQMSLARLARAATVADG